MLQPYFKNPSQCPRGIGSFLLLSILAADSKMGFDRWSLKLLESLFELSKYYKWYNLSLWLDMRFVDVKYGDVKFEGPISLCFWLFCWWSVVEFVHGCVCRCASSVPEPVVTAETCPGVVSMLVIAKAHWCSVGVFFSLKSWPACQFGFLFPTGDFIWCWLSMVWAGGLIGSSTT